VSFYFQSLNRLARTGGIAAVAAMLPILAAPAADAGRKPVPRAADASREVDAAAAKAAVAVRLRSGPSPAMRSAAKTAVNRAAAAELAKGLPPSPLTAESGFGGYGRNAVQVGGHNDPGQDADASNIGTPSDATGAIGATRFIQLVNSRIGIYNRTTDALIAEGALNTLFGQPVDAQSSSPQILWDNQTRRFYYAGTTVRPGDQNVISFGWSTGASPADVTTHWCNYELEFGAFLPDDPKLGDSQHFLLFGTNVFLNGVYDGSDIIAIGKPPAGTDCANVDSLPFDHKEDLREASNPSERVFTPVPANDIETRALGYWVGIDEDVALSGAASTRMYVGSVARGAGGAPVFNNTKNLTVASYRMPADATQLGSTRKLDTLDGRATQAQMAKNPDRANAYSLFTQHTIQGASASSSFVRWYEIDPFPTPPTVLRFGNIGENTPNTFFYNGAISPDRRASGATRQFGDSFVISYNSSRAGAGGYNPRLHVGSSFNGGAVNGFLTVRTSPNAYFDQSCPAATATCRWGGQAAATPDPTPPAGDRGAVWGTSQTAGPGPLTTRGTWDTWFFAHTP
jgi:hypothetical protein